MAFRSKVRCHFDNSAWAVGSTGLATFFRDVAIFDVVEDADAALELPGTLLAGVASSQRKGWRFRA